MAAPRGQLDWLRGGLLLGIAFLLAVALMKPIGVSTQFVILDGILWRLGDPDLVRADPEAKSGYASSNPYLNSSGGKYAKAIAHPWNYSFVFVIALAVGALLSSRLGGPRVDRDAARAPPVWRARCGDKLGLRYVSVFIAGILVLFGARLAGGCTSGHMMSGMMQTALSGYLFSLGAFVVGIPLAMGIFGRK
ncbi:MAG: YeeE/YedE family protein [Planctomycetales bacterium]|nr:YeeE/YedE family protein [Planctomycetales bacterium]